MISILRPAPIGLAMAGLSLLAAWSALAQPSPSPAAPAPAGTRGPSALAFNADGSRLYIAEQDTGQVAVLDPATGATLSRIPSGGEQPVAMAISADGTTLVVANSFSGSLGILDLAGGSLRASVSVPGGPWGVVLTPRGEAFVSQSQLNSIAVVDVPAGKLAGRVILGGIPAAAGRGLLANTPRVQRPRALALTTDGRTLVSANMTGGSLSLVDVDQRRETACLAVPAVNLRGLALSPQGGLAYVSCQEPQSAFSTASPEATWSNLLLEVRFSEGGSPAIRRIVLDHPDRGSADPGPVALAASGQRIYVACAGTHEIASVAAGGGEVERIPAGANPRAIAVRPQSGEIWVANHLGNSLTVLPPEGRWIRSLALEPPSRVDIRMRGRFLFTGAQLTKGRHFTCNTCHPEGNTDGLAWRFSHLADGIERRNSRNLRGTVLLTSPYRWVPREEDFEDFVKDEVRGLLGGRVLAHPDLHAFWDLVNEMPLPPNPYRSADGSLTEAAVRGRALYAGAAGCASCHGGPNFGGTGKRAWVHTTPRTLPLDVPHLAGVYDSAPYLHDGRAATLEEIFTREDPSHAHGKAHLLTPEQFRDLLEYVRSL